MVLLTLADSACVRSGGDENRAPEAKVDLPAQGADPHNAVLAGGCFWCVEAVFEPLDGVLDVVSGYAGDSAATANYRAVCSGSTNHAEAVRITYDPARISYGKLLEIFFTVAHDPTQLNRQGPDGGRQYRSAVFYQNEDQKRTVEAYIRQLEDGGHFADPIVTSLEPLSTFYPAEPDHQDYARLNPAQPYIQAFAAPKVTKLRQRYADRLGQSDR